MPYDPHFLSGRETFLPSAPSHAANCLLYSTELYGSYWQSSPLISFFSIQTCIFQLRIQEPLLRVCNKCARELSVANSLLPPFSLPKLSFLHISLCGPVLTRDKKLMQDVVSLTLKLPFGHGICSEHSKQYLASVNNSNVGGGGNICASLLVTWNQHYVSTQS